MGGCVDGWMQQQFTVFTLVLRLLLCYLFANALVLLDTHHHLHHQEVLAAPVVLLVVSFALRSLNPNLANAASGLGATPATEFLTVTLPMALRPLRERAAGGDERESLMRPAAAPAGLRCWHPFCRASQDPASKPHPPSLDT